MFGRSRSITTGWPRTDGHTVYILGNEFGGFVGIADLRLANDFALVAAIVGLIMTAVRRARRLP